MKRDLTPFGKSVKIRLMDLGKTQEWLIAECRKRTGKYYDSSYLWRILTGQNTNADFIAAIKAVLNLPDDAEG